jgi:hypothetical protein
LKPTVDHAAGTVTIELAELNLKPGHYVLHKKLNNMSLKSEESFKVAGKLTFTTLAFELTKDLEPSDNLVKMAEDKKIEFPAKVEAESKGEDGTFMHIALPFLSHSTHAYLTLSNVASNDNLSVKAGGYQMFDVASFIKAGKPAPEPKDNPEEEEMPEEVAEEDMTEYDPIYVITFDFSEKLD